MGIDCQQGSEYGLVQYSRV